MGSVAEEAKQNPRYESVWKPNDAPPNEVPLSIVEARFAIRMSTASGISMWADS